MTGRLPRGARRHWQALDRPALPVPPAVDTAAIAALPEPARRWLGRAVPPGTPAWSVAELSMRGEIRLGGAWHAFSARQLLAPGVGFVWAARTRVLGLPVAGFDRYGPGGGELRWRLLGVVPVLSAAGADVSRSAAGRLAGEGVLVPTACPRAVWSEGPAPDTAVMSWVLDGEREDTVVRVDPEGRLRELSMRRWGRSRRHRVRPAPLRGRAVRGDRRRRRPRARRPERRLGVGERAAGRGRVLPGADRGRPSPVS
ncbi:DUF6544 family protein [Kocuria sp. M1N1S27]|uniref:DUF6544 family protein n=1 Tax=Kocuria kalidii TaxID=3376283 RepID=UPI0037BD3C17